MWAGSDCIFVMVLDKSTSIVEQITSGNIRAAARLITRVEKRDPEAINIINEAIEKERDFFDSECLTGTLEDYANDLRIKIIDRGSKYEIDLDPISGEGHDFGFIVKKKSKKVDLDTFSVGEVISEEE